MTAALRPAVYGCQPGASSALSVSKLLDANRQGVGFYVDGFGQTQRFQVLIQVIVPNRTDNINTFFLTQLNNQLAKRRPGSSNQQPVPFPAPSRRP